VVEIASSHGTGWGNEVEYIVKGGDRSVVTEMGGGGDLAGKGEKTLEYFSVENATLGGTLHIPAYDDQANIRDDWELALVIK
jgi:hypothetical protein